MKQQRNIIISLLAVAVLAGGAIAVMSSSKSDNTAAPTRKSQASTSDSSSAVATTKVDIKDYMFAPMAIKVKVGDTVTWTNQDGVRHSVVADKPSADAPDGPLIAKGETYDFTFKKAGTYTFHCMPHPYMHGTVVVTE